MYDYDYGYGYDTTVAESATDSLAVFGTIGIVISVISLIVGIIMLIALIKVFKKGGKPAWAVFIPIYNIITMLNIANLPAWYIILYIIPIANIYATYKTWAGICKMYGKGSGFAIAMLFVPFICLPILAFSKNKDGVSSISETNTQNEMPIQQDLDINNDVFNGLDQMNNMQFNDSMMSQPEPMVQPTMMSEPEPMVQPTMMSQPEPMVQSTMMSQPEPMAQPTMMSQPEPMVQPTMMYEPEPMTQPTMMSQPEPMMQPTMMNQPQQNTNDTFKECPNCHAKIRNDASACFMCGTKLS